jgi:hypothetical protein
MALDTVSIELLLIGFLVANLLIGLVYVKLGRNKANRTARESAMISEAIRDYFRRSGVDVSVGCTSLEGERHYTAFIESEPMKRFRLSHIIEATLSEHVLKTCKLELEKIYWRFPIKEGALQRAEPEAAARNDERDPRGMRNARPAVAGAPASASASPADAAAEAAPTDDYINEGLVHYKHLPKVEVTELSWEKFQEASTAAATKPPPK